ncbi:hypothetical protein DH2020_013704 [Rehmannia glutinosa]|uniref:Pentatricopeptide repeat-containing protein n=1 Tax=Rehmannia glutinosa TaxID=99300 RepID=A0ABR0X6R0_REHGL
MPQFASYYLKSSHRAVSLLRQRCLTTPQLKQVQSNLIVSGAIRDPFVIGKLSAHFAITDLSHAQTLLHLASHRSVSIWNTAIRALSENHQPENAFLLCKQMVNSTILPDNYTFSFVFRACAEISDVVLVLMHHSLVIKLGWERHDYVQNGLIHCYASCKSIEYAHKVFDHSSNRDIVSWTAVINGYLKIGELQCARELFDEMPDKNAVTWSSMINGYTQMGMFVEVLQTFNDMLIAGIQPNPSGLAELSACAHLGALIQGKWIHAYIDLNNINLDIALSTTLIDMYAKCGRIDIACDVFDKMPHRDVFAYTSLILGLADHGETMRALEFFKRMENEGVRPNEVTFICVLSACSRMGLVEEGLRIFGTMTGIYGIVPGPKHYGCLVDLLGRAGLVEQAEKVVRMMPMEPDSYVMGALLNACRVHGDDMVVGKLMVDGLNEGSLDHSGLHVLVSNIYASVNKWDYVERARKGMVEKRVKKVTGCSLLEALLRVRSRVTPEMTDSLTTSTPTEVTKEAQHLKFAIDLFEKASVNDRIMTSRVFFSPKIDPALCVSDC